jgi:ribosomal-protein-alanine N-acetyltransferase
MAAMDPLNDIQTPRLILRLMNEEVTTACLAGDLDSAALLLGVSIPNDLLHQPAGLECGREELAMDPHYRPWSMRAIILSQTRTMVGLTRFHSRPDPEYLHGYARDAVEVGYCIFTDYRRRGYATEAVRAFMRWAQSVFGTRRFIAAVSSDNQPSLRLIARFGFAQVGTEVDDHDGIELVFLRTVSVP